VQVNIDPPWRAAGTVRSLGVQTRDITFSDGR
jgi:hypothetical protein